MVILVFLIEECLYFPSTFIWFLYIFTIFYDLLAFCCREDRSLFCLVEWDFLITVVRVRVASGPGPLFSWLPSKHVRFPLQAERHGLGDPQGVPGLSVTGAQVHSAEMSPDQCVSFLMMMFPEDSGCFDEGMCVWPGDCCWLLL